MKTNTKYNNNDIVTVETGINDQGKNIISALIVPTDTEGVTITSDDDKMGVRGSDTAEIVLEDVRVPASHLLGDPETGFKQFLSTLDGRRISIAELGVVIAQVSFAKALDY